LSSPFIGSGFPTADVPHFIWVSELPVPQLQQFSAVSREDSLQIESKFRELPNKKALSMDLNENSSSVPQLLEASLLQRLPSNGLCIVSCLVVVA
jgi:hypothetical protein